MNIWFVLWLLLSAALLYFTGWTFLILQKQKRAWRVFATKYKLRYDAPGAPEGGDAPAAGTALHEARGVRNARDVGSQGVSNRETGRV